eukprot:Em0020g835a
MNLTQETTERPSELLFISFNQDATSLSVGTRSGYKLFSLSPLSAEKLEPPIEKEGGEVCIVERLFSSSLVALVELSNPRKLRVCHFKKNSEICTYSYPDSILSVKLNRQRLLVVLRQNLYIHNIRDMKVMHTIRDTPNNPTGLALDAVVCVRYPVIMTMVNIAYPGSNQNGEVLVFDSINLKAVATIMAHDSQLVALAFNAQGSKLATASATGTVIRVFSVPQGEKLVEFRRGVKRAQISCLSFSPEDTYLAISSCTDTVHVFRLSEPQEEKHGEDQQGWMSYFGKALSSSATYLTSQVTDAFNQSRAFAMMKLPKTGLKTICAMTIVDGVHKVMVATSEGMLYVTSVETRDGGECRNPVEYRLLDAAGCSSP